MHAEQHAAYEALQGLGLLESAIDFVPTSDQGSQLLQPMGGTLSRHTSVAGSRAGSRPSSRQGSRRPSHSSSRHGSFTHLDHSMEMDSSRSYTSGYPSLQRNGGVVNNTNHIHHQKNVYVEDYHHPRNPSSTLPHRHARSGSAGESHHLITGSTTLPHNYSQRSGSMGEIHHSITGSSTLPYHQTLGVSTDTRHHHHNHHVTDSSVISENRHRRTNSVGGDTSGYPILIASPEQIRHLVNESVTEQAAAGHSIGFPVLNAKYNPADREEKEKITYTYTNAQNGNIPRSLSLDHKDGGIGAQYDDISSYSGQSSGYVTMPRNPTDHIGSSSYSSHQVNIYSCLCGHSYHCNVFFNLNHEI